MRWKNRLVKFLLSVNWSVEGILETLFGLVPIERVRELHDAHTAAREAAEREYFAQDRKLRDYYNAKLEETAKLAGNIVANLSHITFDRRRNVYSVRVDIAPEMMQGGWQSDKERRWVAEHTGHLVAREIATGRYLEKSYETEMEERRLCRPRYGFGNY